MTLQPATYPATSQQNVALPDDQGRLVVLYFYPKDATSGCTQEGLDFSALNNDFSQHNTVIYGVSKDSLKSHENFKAKQNFVFELIADEDEKLCQLLNVIQLKKLYGKEYMGIVRSTFVISPTGEIIKHWDKVKVKDHAQEVLDFIKSIDSHF